MPLILALCFVCQIASNETTEAHGWEAGVTASLCNISLTATNRGRFPEGHSCYYQ
jgi:hypothetical protein